MRQNIKYIFSLLWLFLQTHKIGFLIKQIFKKVACVDSKIFCKVFAATFSQISFKPQINSTIAHLFQHVLYRGRRHLSMWKKVKENSFSGWNIAFFTRRSAKCQWVYRQNLSFLKIQDFSQKLPSTLSIKAHALCNWYQITFQEAFLLHLKLKNISYENVFQPM